MTLLIAGGIAIWVTVASWIIAFIVFALCQCARRFWS